MTAANRLMIDMTNFFSDAVGEDGVAESEVEALSPRLDGLRDRLARWRSGNEPSFFHLPFEPEHLETVYEWGQEITAGFEQLLVLGMGGSSLGGEMLVHCLGGSEEFSDVLFIDNVDPVRIEETLEGVEWSGTMVLAISKSGNTAETLAQLLTLLPHMERAIGARAVKDHLVVITEDERGGLAEVGRTLRAPIVPHPPVGGRYSVLSTVGLLPGYVAGVDVEGIIDGASSMAERCLSGDMRENPAFWGGATQYLLAEQGKNQTILMPYFERLNKVGSWFRQLWAESLGKLDAAGNHRGLTPARALGATDQHSQLQLYLQGPADKQFTLFIADEMVYYGDRIPARFKDIPAVSPLAGHSVGELLAAEFMATRETLTRNGRPNRTIRMPALDAFTLGELIMLLEVETVVVAELLGVDPFDQPAVEEGKILTREYLARMEGQLSL
ncbi:glucose-6-phosphate isomerase [Thiohalorhabdus methylotrophus]|uniref:Glucose-6-phosphate isomerase n=1 Tax=Thiohalorhabdus methylotrophus TaxID=3242694 RepID=A0ABV4TXU4_9GAMM